jgi:hypothetical protein
MLVAFFYIFLGVTTVFSNNDKFNPNPNLACLHRDLKTGEKALAHRTLPCGSLLKLYNLRTGKTTFARVKDRGPFGKYKKNEEGLNKDINPIVGEYKSVLDITPAVQRELDHNGEDILLITVEEFGWPKNRNYQKSNS